MTAILTATGRVLWRHWPALLAWFLGGMLVRHLLIVLAGLVGGFTATGGLLLLPLAVLARLIGFVGMFLVVRDGLRSLQALAPLPVDPRERRRDFLDALLISVLPFFAIYTAQNELRGDVIEYTERALDVRIGQIFAQAVDTGDAESSETVLSLGLNVWTVLIIVLALAGRWAWSRWGSRLPRVLALAALYCEVVWVFFSLLLVSRLLDDATAWVGSRAVTQWLSDLRSWASTQLVPLDWLLSAVQWLWTDGGRVLVEPLAWLLVAGVVYGQAIAAEQVRVENRILARARSTVGRVPSAVRQRAARLTSGIQERVEPFRHALSLIWHAGPILIGGYIFFYAVARSLDPLLQLGIVHVLGPHDIAFWSATSVLLALVPQVLAEPVRIALVAGAYDTMLARPRERAVADGAAQGSIENRTNAGAVSYGATSTQNGPSASTGTMNGTSSS